MAPRSRSQRISGIVVHVLSGQENKVRENIDKRVKTEEMSDFIFEVLLPTERVSEIKRGKKTETTRKFFPGYLIVNMHLLDENNQLVGRRGISFGHARCDRLCRNEGSPDPDAAIRSRQHAGANARARREGKTENQLRSRARRSKWPTVHSKTRTASSKRSIPSAANCAFPSDLRSRHAGGTRVLAGRTRLEN